MLLSSFGNLSHTSIRYYTVLLVITGFEWYGIRNSRKQAMSAKGEKKESKAKKRLNPTA
jgi:hypothetical protein